MPIDPERQRQAKAYARLRHRLFALNLALSGVALVAVLALGLNVWLDQLIQAVTTDIWIATLLYFLVAMIAYEALFFPLSYYSGFVLPHRFGLSTQTLASWLQDVAKGGALGVVLGGVVIEVVYAVLRATPGSWWLWATLFMILFNILLTHLAPVLIFPLFFRFQPLQDAELVERLTALAARAHARVGGVYTMIMSEKTTEANAALMGLGNTRRIVLGDTLYRTIPIQRSRRSSRTSWGTTCITTSAGGCWSNRSSRRWGLSSRTCSCGGGWRRFITEALPISPRCRSLGWRSACSG